MKAKLKTVLKSNVDPLFFVLACVVLFSVSVAAKTLADDVLSEVDGAPDTVTRITTDGRTVWHVE